VARCVQPLICPFDISREGYVNLLLTGQKKPKILGDTKDMVRARRNFLDRGFYSPLSDAINEYVYNHLVGGSGTNDEPLPTCAAEIGCGEGYFIGRLKYHLDSRLETGSICYFGMDISREALRLAAKRYKETRFFVANVNKKILFSDHSIRVLLNIFAPRNAGEFDRVMTGDGMLLVAIPGPGHLASLRSDLGLLDIEPNKQQRVVELFAGTFKLAEKRTMEYEMHLSGEELCDLVGMTPNYWHISEETWDGIKARKRVQTEASFTILTFCR